MITKIAIKNSVGRFFQRVILDWRAIAPLAVVMSRGPDGAMPFARIPVHKCLNFIASLRLDTVRACQFPSISVANTAERERATFVRTILNGSTGANTVDGTPDQPWLTDSSTGVLVAAARPLLRLPQVAAVGCGSA